MPADLCVFGVTGFTGQLVLAYLETLKKSNRLPSNLAVSVAGRDTDKVAQLAAKLCPSLQPQIVQADVADERSVYRMVADARCVLSCVGPYEQLGEPVVKACASLGVDYVDVTGEGRWVQAMRAKYDDVAKRSGALLVPFAGNDSVPSDLSAWFTLSQVPPEELKQSHAALLTCARLTGKGVSNGTFKTLLNLLETGAAKLEPLGGSEGGSPPQPRLREGVQLVQEVPASHGGPLAVLTSELMPDAYVIRSTHAQQPEHEAGRLESAYAIALPNRAVAYAAQAGLLAAPLAARALGPLLRRLSSAGQGPGLAGKPEPYSLFSVLSLYPLRGAENELPLERVVTRLDADRDPYLVTAITCTQIALGLLSDLRPDLPGVRKGDAGFHTPVSALGGQHLLERCFECFRVQLVARM